MLELLLYLFIGATAASAQYVMDDRELWKVVIVFVFWPYFMLVACWLVILRNAE